MWRTTILLVVTWLCAPALRATAVLAQPAVETSAAIGGPSVEDARRVEQEEELKALLRDEAGAVGLDVRERLLDRIIRLSIDLDRDAVPHQARLEDVKRLKKEESERLADETARDHAVRAIITSSLATLASRRPSRTALAKVAEDVESGLARSPGHQTLIRLRSRTTSALRAWWMRAAGLAILALGCLTATLALVWRLRRGRGVRTLEVLDGPQCGERFRIETDTTTVGTLATEVDIVILDPLQAVSRRHLDIIREGSHHFVVDRSSNGTRVNGRRLSPGEPELLRRGAIIALPGDIALRFW